MILKELKQAEGDFTEDQKIELNTVRSSGFYSEVSTKTHSIDTHLWYIFWRYMCLCCSCSGSITTTWPSFTAQWSSSTASSGCLSSASGDPSGWDQTPSCLWFRFYFPPFSVFSHSISSLTVFQKHNQCHSLSSAKLDGRKTDFKFKKRWKKMCRMPSNKSFICYYSDIFSHGFR